MNGGILRHAAILGAFCTGFGIVLAMTNELASQDIADRAMEDRLASLTQVLPAELHDSNPLQNTLIATDADGKELTVYRARKDGRVTGVAFEIRGSGYAGGIKMMMGVDTEGRILGVRVLAHKETPGLGDKIEVKKNPWILSFDRLSFAALSAEKWKVKKDGGHFDQFAGATITPRAVVAAVRRGLEFFEAHKGQLMEVGQ